MVVITYYCAGLFRERGC